MSESSTGETSPRLILEPFACLEQFEIGSYRKDIGENFKVTPHPTRDNIKNILAGSLDEELKKTAKEALFNNQPSEWITNTFNNPARKFTMLFRCQILWRPFDEREWLRNIMEYVVSLQNSSLHVSPMIIIEY